MGIKGKAVSLPVIRRLPRYHRFLCALKDSGIIRISSDELARRMGLTASQIRQDLNCFGGFGQQGYGYNVDQLTHEIEKILCLNQSLDAIIVGAGNLGRALTSHLYDAKGIRLIGLFDKNPQPLSGFHPDLEVMGLDGLEAFCRARRPSIAILCIPADQAQFMATLLAGYGIRGFWNFSNVDLELAGNLCVENVHLRDSIMTLGYNVNQLLSDAEAGGS